MKSNERVFCFYEIKVNVKTESGNPGKVVTIKDVFEKFSLIDKEDYHPRRLGSKHLFGIDDFILKEKSVEILFYRSDLEESPPSVRDHITEEIRELERNETEGNSYSSHAVIIFNDENKKIPALMLIEQCKGIGPARIESILRQIFRKYKKVDKNYFLQNKVGDFKDASGQYIKESVAYDFEIKGIPSDTFISDLNNGELTLFELIKDGSMVETFDEESYFEEKEAVIKLQVADKNSLGNGRFQQVMRILNVWKNDYSKARLRIKPRNANEYTIDWESNSGFSEEYVKRVTVKPFSPPLKSSYKKIYRPIMDRMNSEAQKNA